MREERERGDGEEQSTKDTREVIIAGDSRHISTTSAQIPRQRTAQEREHMERGEGMRGRQTHEVSLALEDAGARGGGVEAALVHDPLRGGHWRVRAREREKVTWGTRVGTHSRRPPSAVGKEGRGRVFTQIAASFPRSLFLCCSFPSFPSFPTPSPASDAHRTDKGVFRRERADGAHGRSSGIGGGDMKLGKGPVAAEVRDNRRQEGESAEGRKLGDRLGVLLVPPSPPPCGVPRAVTLYPCCTRSFYVLVSRRDSAKRDHEGETASSAAPAAVKLAQPWAASERQKCRIIR